MIKQILPVYISKESQGQRLNRLLRLAYIALMLPTLSMAGCKLMKPAEQTLVGTWFKYLSMYLHTEAETDGERSKTFLAQTELTCADDGTFEQTMFILDEATQEVLGQRYVGTGTYSLAGEGSCPNSVHSPAGQAAAE